jgi:hypothetical protein
MAYGLFRCESVIGDGSVDDIRIGGLAAHLQALAAGGHTGNFQEMVGLGPSPRRKIVSARRGRTRRRGRITSVAQVKAPSHRRFLWIFAALLLILAGAAAGSARTEQGRDVLAAIQRFLLFYSGVFALVALTAAVGVGVLATDRIVMAAGGRVVTQAVHRAFSFAALAFLATHIALEVVAHRSRVIDAFVPFLAHGRTFYVGLGTVASDLVVLIVMTGIARGRFVGRRPWTWRAVHATAYLAWPMAIAHGLLAGRTAKPYVDWSYGACLAVVALALMIRLVAAIRGGKQTAAHPVAEHGAAPAYGSVPAVMPERLPGVGPAMPRRPAPRALPPGAGGQARHPLARHPQAPPYLSARRAPAPHPDQPGHPSGPWQYRPAEQAPEPYSSCPGGEGS